MKGFLERDWRLIQQAKSDFHAAQKAAMTPSAAIRLGDELHRFARTMKPDWPNPAERAADLATHVRVSEMLRHAARIVSR